MGISEALDGAVCVDPHKAFGRVLKQGQLKKLICFGERGSLYKKVAKE